MKQVLLNIEDLSDSKEVYGERPNPFLTIFIYALLGLFAVVLIYSLIGKIDIVATASGMIRPNEQVSTVSSMVSGKVTSVKFVDGQAVKKGDVLLTVDASETEASLDALKEQQEDVEFAQKMNEKFIESLQQEKNLFDSDPNGEEYSYYVQFENYAVSLNNTATNSAYNEDKTKLQIQALNKQITLLNSEKAALVLLKQSVEQGKNLLSAYPAYSNQYELYVSTMASLETEYKSKRVAIVNDTTSDSNALTLSYYNEQINGYKLVISSINDGKDYFSSTDKGQYHQLYNEYLGQMNNYQASYNSAYANYTLAASGGSSGQYSSDLLTYYNTMLEGYNYYKKSVESGADSFVDGAASVHYRSLYQEYTKTLATYTDTTSAAAYKASTLASINNTILQVKSNIAQLNITAGTGTVSNSLSVAQSNMEAASAAMNTYKATTLISLNDNVTQLQYKISSLSLTTNTTRPKSDLLTELDTTYQQSKSQKYLNMLTQIEADIKTHDSQIVTCQNDLSLYSRMQKMYLSNKDSDGQSSDVSYAQLQQLAKCLSAVESLDTSLSELGAKVKQAESQVGYCSLKAEQNGVINSVLTVGVGDVLSAGSTVATVIPYDESQYKVQIYIQNKDVASIEVGDTVRYNISALPSSQFGIVEGKVLSISQDTKVQDSKQTGYYLVEASIAKGTLTDKDGNEAEISVGMTVEAKIVTQRKRIISFLLEKIK